MPRGLLIIISSPSGAGKTTLARRLLGEFQGRIGFSVSYTTRKARIGEQDGVDYHFVEPDQFAAMIEHGEFAEWAKVHGNCYGTSRQVVESALAAGKGLVFDVDWQGGRALAEKWPSDALRIFVLPPDLASLESRLRRRATDADEIIRRRLEVALSEMGHHVEYEHRIINDDLEQAYAMLRAIYLIRRDGSDAHPELLELYRESRGEGPIRHVQALLAARPTDSQE